MEKAKRDSTRNMSAKKVKHGKAGPKESGDRMTEVLQDSTNVAAAGETPQGRSVSNGKLTAADKNVSAMLDLCQFHFKICLYKTFIFFTEF